MTAPSGSPPTAVPTLRPRDRATRSGSPSTPRRRRRGATAILAGLLAELLLVGGAGIGLYALWTTWYTDVKGVAEQKALVEKLDQPATPAGGVEHTAADSDIPVLQEPKGLADVFGTMRIPRFGADYERPIGEGTDRQKVLNTIGLGHYEGTAMPGDVGNFAVAGHRVTYGKPLNQIADLEKGDPIVVRVTDRAARFDVWYVYEVTDAEIVSTWSGVSPGERDRWLTLTACHPMWSAAERYVVHAKLTSWMPAKDGTPKELSKGARS